MQGFNGAFWIGLALAVPLSIIGNLISPKVQAWLARKSEISATKREQETVAERERINAYIAKPQRLYTYLLGAVLAATLIGSVSGVLSGVLFLAGTFSSERVLFGSGQAIAIFGGVLVAKICVDAIKIIGKVRSGGG